MAKDGTNRGGRRVRAGDKPKPLAEKIAAGEDADIIEFTPTVLEGADLDDAADLVGEEIKAGAKCMAFGDFSYYWIADRSGRTFKRLNELFAMTGQVGFLAMERLDGKLILPEAIKTLKVKSGSGA